MNEPDNHSPSHPRGDAGRLLESRRLFGRWAGPAVQATARYLVRGRTALDVSGMSRHVWLRAGVITLLFFFMLNHWLGSSVDRSYFRAQPLAINQARSSDEAILAAIRYADAEAKMAQEEFVRETFRQHPVDATCRDYILNFIRVVQGTASPAVVATLDDALTGRRRGFSGLVVQAEIVSGAAVVEALRDADPNWNHKTALLEDPGSRVRGEEADVFLAKFIDRTAQESRPAVRNLMRLNGWIQWLAICVCCVVLLLSLGRAGLLARLASEGWFPASQSEAARILGTYCAEPGPTPTPSAAAFAAENNVQQLLDRQVYATYEFLIALLPSLGFIGTVLGMGDALLSADSLFSAADKNRAISLITSHLGFAFDTTLIGLVTGIVAGIAVLRLRLWESALWQRAEAKGASLPLHVVAASQTSDRRTQPAN